MTEEQRKAALEALNVMEANEYWHRGDFSENIATIREALQSPPVPAIEGLDDAIDNLKDASGKYCHLNEKDIFHLKMVIKAARAYSKLQKGEQNGHDQS